MGFLILIVSLVFRGYPNLALVNFNPQDMDGIVDPNLSVATLHDEDTADYELLTTQPGKNNQTHQSWRPPESWNSRRKPSISTEDDKSLEKQLSIDSDQMVTQIYGVGSKYHNPVLHAHIPKE